MSPKCINKLNGSDDIYIVLLAPPQSDLKHQALRSLEKLPPFSPVLNRLMATVAMEDVAFGKIADVIEKDTVLAGNVLKLVNSAMYGRSRNVNSIRHAVSILGVTKLRNATLGMSIARMWNGIPTPLGWSMARFNLHSIATAILADLLSQEVPVDYPEGAFVAGLLHDLGLLLIAVALPEQYRALEQGECEEQVLGFTHGELSAEALGIWNLPEPIQNAVRYHHSPEPGPLPLSRLLQLTEEYVDGAPESNPECLAPLMLNDKLPKILTEFDTEFQAIKTAF
ncbi:MAG: HDOD domain-containing protein [Acidobacteriota bacterium]|nr:HDOD domain-containing protein [Acidobacteriota bacterium]